jgi:hypothetical protein
MFSSAAPSSSIQFVTHFVDIPTGTKFISRSNPVYFFTHFLLFKYPRSDRTAWLLSEFLIILFYQDPGDLVTLFQDSLTGVLVLKLTPFSWPE